MNFWLELRKRVENVDANTDVDAYLLSVENLDDDVANATERQHHQQNVEFHAGAERCGIGVGDDKSGGFPQAIVGEGGLLVPPEEQAIETVDLCLPDGIGDTPETGHGIEDERIVGIGTPEEFDRDEREMDNGAQHNDGQASNVFHHRAKQYGAECVDHTKADHNEANLMDTQCTGDICLCEIGSNEGLLHANEYGDRYEQLQIRFLHLTERRR